MTKPPMTDLILVLDNLRSVYNTAAIARSAWFFGVNTIWACGTTPLPVDRFGRARQDFAKVALGAEHAVFFRPFLSTREALAHARKEGRRVVCLEQHESAVPLEEGVRGNHEPLALVLGEERHGIAPEILAQADAVWEIRRYGGKESLNVAVAAGIALWAIRALAEG